MDNSIITLLKYIFYNNCGTSWHFYRLGMSVFQNKAPDAVKVATDAIGVNDEFCAP